MSDKKSTAIEEHVSILKRYRLDQMIAGIASGGISTCILHPLDLVKTQFQVQTTARSEIVTKPYMYTFRYLNNLYAQFGLRRGLYQGLSANLAGSTATWGLYFYLYDWTKTFFPASPKGTLASKDYFIASSAAAAITVLFTNPLWMIKTRLCMQVPGASSNYSGLWNALNRISKEEGLKGLYRGLVPGLFGVTHGAIQFMVYEQLKNLHRQNQNRNHDKIRPPATLEYLLMSSLSKTAAMIITYPYQVVRSRLQVRNNHNFYDADEFKNIKNRQFSYKGVVDVIRSTYKFEGLWAFYRGIIPSTIRVLPGTCITFLVYEKVSAALKA